MSNTYVADEKKPKFKFSEFSLKSINALTKAYQEALSELEKISKNPGSFIDETYGVCNNRYKMRYITPHNISEFVSYVGRIINDRPFPVENVNDMEIMTVAMLQRFVNDNKKCIPFEDTNAYGSNAYIDQRTINLPKLLVMCNNEFYDTSVYSKADLESRAKAMSDDIKLLTDLKFDKNVDKLVDAIPKVVSENCPDVNYNPKMGRLVAEVVTRFIETACAINLCTVEQMIAYCVPNKTYTVKKETHNPNARYDYDYYDEQSFDMTVEENESDLVETYYTECCLLKTNDIRIHSKIPFNCNIRDVVLQDMHPTFKDTQSAIMFMISDERSPITSLLRKYRTVEKIQPNYRILNMFMHLRHENVFDTEKNDPYYLANKNGMHTDPNWLDKITYGNQFLDGNYRSDALGNNKFTPMEDTLNHVYSMYCCEGLKTNEELANHIVEVANVMTGIIEQYKTGGEGCVCNWEMMRDILAVFGEILTRAILKLYDNNSKVFTISDTMDDTAGPSYMYTESFNMFMEEVGPSIKVDSNKTGIAKAWGNAKALIAKFIRWIQDVFSKINGNFLKKYGEQIEWVKNNPELNQKIENALNSGFTVNLTNYTKFDVKIDAMKNIKSKEVIEELINENKPFTANDIIKGIIAKMPNVEGLGDLTNGPDQKGNLKEYCDNLINYFLYGNPKPSPLPNGPMKGETWRDIYTNIIQSPDGVETAVSYLKGDMDAASKLLQTKINSQNNNPTNTQSTNNNPQATPPAQQGENNGQQGEQQKPQELTVDWQKNLIEFTNVTKMLHMGIINAIDNKFYMTNYKLYRDIVSAYNNQYSENQGAPEAKTDNQ